MVEYTVKTVSVATDTAIWAIVEASSTVKTIVEVYKVTPGSVRTLQDATGVFIYTIGHRYYILKPFNPKHEDVKKHNHFIPSLLEEGERKLNFIESIYR